LFGVPFDIDRVTGKLPLSKASIHTFLGSRLCQDNPKDARRDVFSVADLSGAADEVCDVSRNRISGPYQFGKSNQIVHISSGFRSLAWKRRRLVPDWEVAPVFYAPRHRGKMICADKTENQCLSVFICVRPVHLRSQA
jgi:hypothetical protein